MTNTTLWIKKLEDDHFWELCTCDGVSNEYSEECQMNADDIKEELTFYIKHYERDPPVHHIVITLLEKLLRKMIIDKDEEICFFTCVSRL